MKYCKFHCLNFQSLLWVNITLSYGQSYIHAFWVRRIGSSTFYNKYLEEDQLQKSLGSKNPKAGENKFSSYCQVQGSNYTNILVKPTPADIAGKQCPLRGRSSRSRLISIGSKCKGIPTRSTVRPLLVKTTASPGVYDLKFLNNVAELVIALEENYFFVILPPIKRLLPWHCTKRVWL